MKKLLIAATLTAAAIGATPLLAQQAESKQKPAQTAATEGCAMGGEHGNREARHAQMQAMHAQMGSHEGRGQGHGMQGEHRN